MGQTEDKKDLLDILSDFVQWILDIFSNFI